MMYLAPQCVVVGWSGKIHLKEEHLRLLMENHKSAPPCHAKSWQGRKLAATLSKQQSLGLQRPWPITHQLADVQDR